MPRFVSFGSSLATEGRGGGCIVFKCYSSKKLRLLSTAEFGKKTLRELKCQLLRQVRNGRKLSRTGLLLVSMLS